MTRAAFELGSGSTKLIVAKVDICSLKLLQVIHRQNLAVPFGADVESKPAGQMSEEMMARGVQTLKRLRTAAAGFGASEYQAVATQAFRQAKNVQAFINRASEEVQLLKIRVLSKEEERAYLFASALRSSGAPPEKTYVWDIGGTYQQISTPGSSGLPQSLFDGPVGSEDFYQYVIGVIQGDRKKKTANPMSATHIEKAAGFAHAILAVMPNKMKTKIRTGTLVGVGGVFYNSVFEQVKKLIPGAKTLTPENVRQTLTAKTGLDDGDVGGGRFARLEVTNLALVLGLMEGAGIREIKPVNLSSADGLLTQWSRWPKAQAIRNQICSN